MTALLVKVRGVTPLLKPGLGASILITIAPGLLLGAQLPDLRLIVFTMIGTFLVAIGSFAYNQILEERTDALMERTRGRPLPSGLITTLQAHIIGSSLLGIGLALLLINVNPLAAFIALCSFVYYVFIYTAWLKPRTSLNTALGGMAGAVGPLIGEAAIRGSISQASVYMFLLLFLWQPPHFWCLGLKYKDEYAAAGIPILPVAKGVPETLRQMIVYEWLLLGAIFIGWIPLGLAGPIFAIPALAYGAFVLFLMYRLKASGGTASPLRVFFLTIGHMLLWHIALAADLYVRRWLP